MRFGKRQLGARLVIARLLTYCQAAALALVALNLLEVLLIGGAGSGLSFRGLLATTAINGSGAVVSALAFVVVALVLIAVEQRAAGGGAARRTLAAAELAFALCFVAFVANAAGGWVIGPAAALAVVGLHCWPELRAYFFADESVGTAGDGDAPQAAIPAPASAAGVSWGIAAAPPAAPDAPLSPQPAYPGPALPAAGAGSRETAPPHL